MKLSEIEGMGFHWESHSLVEGKTGRPVGRVTRWAHAMREFGRYGDYLVDEGDIIEIKPEEI